MKIVLLLIIACGLCQKGITQSEGGMEQQYSFAESNTFSWMPVAWYVTDKNWYLEGRYNYEAANTVSFYTGKIFDGGGKLAYSICPVAGVVAGDFNGGSAGVNAEVAYRKLNFSTQSQYTFSIDNKAGSFFYSWSELSYSVSKRFEAGASLQHTKEYRNKNHLEKGVFIRTVFKRFSFPVYLYEPASKHRYLVVGLNFTGKYRNNIQSKK